MINFKLTIGIFLVAVLAVTAIVGPLITPHFFPGENPTSVGEYPTLDSPSPKHPLGTDILGRDAVVIIINGIRLSLIIGVVGSFISTLIGVVLGFIAGYVGKRTDTILRIFIDMVLVIPILPLLLLLSIYIPKWNIFTMGALLGIFSWPFVARTTRAQVLSLRERSYVDLARLNNEGTLEIIFEELLPGLLPYVILSLAGATVGNMLAEAGLQLIGIGATLPPTLGSIMGRAYNGGAISLGLYGQLMIPAGILVMVFLALNLINMGLEEHFNPRLRLYAEER
jgi:peptide/nickel transport system permease protein